MTKLVLFVLLVAAFGCGEVLKETPDAPNPAVCGNGAVEGAEECDDGNTVDSDDCTNSCTNATCGDGITNTAGITPEQCDDGNTENGDDCTNACKTATCGDGIVRTTGTTIEGCDDGNTENADDCTNACNVAACGDGIVHNMGTGTEACDPPMGTDLDGVCTSSCRNATCPGLGGLAQAGPHIQYHYCWYLGNDGQTCDAVCSSLAGTNMAVAAANAWPDACQGATNVDVSIWFFNNGNVGGWAATTGGTSYHTLGYGYRGQQYYGKCAAGTTSGNGSFPTDTNSATNRSLICPCFAPQ